MANPIPFSAPDEVAPAGEAEHIARIIEILRQTLQIHFEKTGEARRDVHAKSNGSARGEFRVSPALPAELAQGLFEIEGTYPAAVRFSNSAPWLQADVVPDGRGLAIQVEQVPGEKLAGSTTQDFVMVNHPCFIAANVRDFLEIEEARLQAGDQPLMLAASFAARNWNPLHWNWREGLAAVQVAAQLPAHPASYIYFSMSPIRYGQFVAKYRVLPAAELSTSAFDSAAAMAADRDAMRHLLAETLERQQLTFLFQVQLRTSADSMPIEDASVVWPEAESPFRTVAQLTLPRQNIPAAPRAEDERRAFSVWNALAAHQPLGGINRLRQFAYPVSAAFRNEK